MNYMQQLDKIADNKITIAEVVKSLVNVKKTADGGLPLISNQGQAIDGYSELANYRALIEKLEKLK
jgi:hypothetical protein